MTVKIEFKRKNLIIAIGILLLIVGVLLFLFATQINWDYTTTYNGTVDFRQSIAVQQDKFNFSGYGSTWFYDYPAIPQVMIMHEGDVLDMTITNETFNTLTYAYLTPQNSYKVLAFSEYNSPIEWTAPTDMNLMPSIAVQNRTVAISASVVLHHYATPNWLLFGLGVVSVSGAFVLAVISTRQRQEKSEQKTP
jgi:hypothetical protein